MAKVLLIDGPMKGQVHDADNGGIMFEQLPQELGQRPECGVYSYRRYRLFGRVFIVGSCNPQGPQLDDLDGVFWELLASDLAKDIAEEPRPAGQKEG